VRASGAFSFGDDEAKPEERLTVWIGATQPSFGWGAKGLEMKHPNLYIFK